MSNLHFLYCKFQIFFSFSKLLLEVSNLHFLYCEFQNLYCKLQMFISYTGAPKHIMSFKSSFHILQNSFLILRVSKLILQVLNFPNDTENSNLYFLYCQSQTINCKFQIFISYTAKFESSFLITESFKTYNASSRSSFLLLQNCRVLRLTDHPDMTSAVYRGRKTTVQQEQQLLQNSNLHFLY